MKKALLYFRKKWLFKLCFFGLLLSFCVLPVASQSSQNRNFPSGSAQGTTQMNQSVRGLTFPNIDINITQPRTGNQMAFNLQVLLLLTILSLAPSILILMTCFLRFSIVLDFIKRALSLQQVPPTSVLNGIALFMTLFVMWPVFQKVYSFSFKPLSAGTNDIIAIARKPPDKAMPLAVVSPPFSTQTGNCVAAATIGAVMARAFAEALTTLPFVALFIT